MGIEALLSTQIIDTTTVGRAVMTAADAAAARTAIHAAGTSHTHAASDIVSGIIETARLATGTASASTYLRGDQTWATVAAAGVGGSTGAVDNAVLRADGIGGATLQASSIVITDNFTASPNNTVNHASIQATGGTTNVSVSIVPKGTGAFCLVVPDGTATGGNARGSRAVDLQMSRSAATQVASGANAFAVGDGCTASGTSSFAAGAGCRAVGSASIAMGSGCVTDTQGNVAIGFNASAAGFGSIALGSAVCNAGYGIAIGGRDNISNGNYSVAIGNFVTSSGEYSVGFQQCTASGSYSWAYGNQAAATHHQSAYAQGSFGSRGDAQRIEWVLRNRTTDGTTAVTLLANGTAVRAIVSSGKILFATLLLVGSKSEGTAVATYMRKFAIRNRAGTTELIGAVETIGTDVPAGTSMSVAADDTNDALNVSVVGVAGETWRWLGSVYGVELAYGT
jgi:hypothetical protein